MLLPTHIEIARLKLRPVALTDDAEIFRVYASRELATRFMPFTRHQALEDSRAFAHQCLDAWMLGSAFPWAVTRKETGHLMGVIELRLQPLKADFGFILGEAYWRQGIATEAARAVVDWAKAQHSIFRVWATCHPANAASAAVLMKAGLSFEATLSNWEARPQLREKAGTSHCYALSKPVK